MRSPAASDVLQKTRAANGRASPPLDDTGTTLAEGTYAFTASETSGSKSSVETGPFRVKVDRTAPAVTLTTDATTYDLTPEVRVVATDLNGIADGTTVTLDVHLNNDGDFADTGETGYASSTLTGGLALFELTPALALGTVKVRARVTDKAGNEGTSSTQTVTLASSGSGWTTSDATLATDPLQGDALLAEGNVHLEHFLDLDNSPGTGTSLDLRLAYNSNRITVQPVIAAQIQSDNGQALPATITAQLTWNGGTPQTAQSFSTTGRTKGGSEKVPGPEINTGSEIEPKANNRGQEGL